MALLSSFELIVQRIIPNTVTPSGIPNPVAVQAYFLLLSNPSSEIAKVTLTFISNPDTDGPSNFNGGGIVPDGDKNFGPVTSFINLANFSPLATFKIKDDFTAVATFSLPPSGTGLLLLQPDVSPLQQFDRTTENFNFELRGFVNIDANPGVSLLASPQVRGTFFDLGETGELLAPPILQPSAVTLTAEEASRKLSLRAYAQQAYSLPTAGSALYQF